MIVLQWQPGKDRRGQKPAPVIAAVGPFTPPTERTEPVKRGRGRPKGSGKK